MQVATVGFETKDLLNIILVRYILYLASKQSAVRTEMISHLNCVTEILHFPPGGGGRCRSFRIPVLQASRTAFSAWNILSGLGDLEQ
jgi:hypothetical protein